MPPTEGRTVIHLDQVVEDLDRHFGFSTNYDGMMSELYKMKQEPYELASFFGIWLQRQIAAIAGEYSDKMWPEEQGRYASEQFYKGLRPEIRNPLKYLMGRPGGLTYADLIEEARKMEGQARGPVLPTEFKNGGQPKRDPQGNTGYPRKPTWTTYFWKLKGSYAPGARVTQVHEPKPTPANTELEEDPEADGDSKEEDISNIMSALAETATGDPDEGANFVAGIYKLGAEVEKRSRRCYSCKSPNHLMQECEKFKVAQASLNLKGGADQKGAAAPAKKNSGWPLKKPSGTHPTSNASMPSSTPQ